MVIIPFGIWFYRYMSQWKAENVERDKHKKEINDAQRLAIMALLRDRILQSGKYFCDLGAIPSYIKTSLLQMGDAYEALGGNGEGHKMIERIKALPINDLVLEEDNDN